MFASVEQQKKEKTFALRFRKSLFIGLTNAAAAAAYSFTVFLCSISAHS